MCYKLIIEFLILFNQTKHKFFLKLLLINYY